jgi:hypothetical protein
VAASQSRATLSAPPVRTALPSGLNAPAWTAPQWEKTAFSPGQWRRQADSWARALRRQAGSPAATAERQHSTVQSRPGPISSFSKAA